MADPVPPTTGWLLRAMERAAAQVATWPPQYRDAMRKEAEANGKR